MAVHLGRGPGVSAGAAPAAADAAPAVGASAAPAAPLLHAATARTPWGTGCGTPNGKPNTPRATSRNTQRSAHRQPGRSPHQRHPKEAPTPDSPKHQPAPRWLANRKDGPRRGTTGRFFRWRRHRCFCGRRRRRCHRRHRRKPVIAFHTVVHDRGRVELPRNVLWSSSAAEIPNPLIRLGGVDP